MSFLPGLDSRLIDREQLHGAIDAPLARVEPPAVDSRAERTAWLIKRPMTDVARYAVALPLIEPIAEPMRSVRPTHITSCHAPILGVVA